MQEESKPMPCQREIAMLRRELEMLMDERQLLLKVTGAAAALIASLDPEQLPVNTVESADLVATALNGLSEESLRDALIAAHAHMENMRD
jgi:DNA-binding MarR family transcriptional regulator